MRKTNAPPRAKIELSPRPPVMTAGDLPMDKEKTSRRTRKPQGDYDMPRKGRESDCVLIQVAPGYNPRKKVRKS